MGLGARVFRLGFAVSLANVACGRPGAVATDGAPAPHAGARRTVRPSETDADAHTPDNPHQIDLPTASNGKLLVFLSGTHGKPTNATDFLEVAAEVGYHAIGLDYPNDDAAVECGKDLKCYGDMRTELWDGTDATTKIDIRPANSIKNRLVKLLAYLAKHHPSEGWEPFLANGEPAYAEIAFAGHSQGGGHAAFIAKRYAVARVLMFSSVCDAGGSPFAPATWVRGAHATPIERYYGFDHVQDEFAPRIAVTWPALGLDALGPRTSVDGAEPPYGRAHELVTSVPEPDGQHAHTCVVTNASTPRKDGVPVFRDVWRYMLGG